MVGDFLAEALSNNGEKPWKVEHEVDTDMKTTGAVYFHSNILERKPETALRMSL